MIITLQSGLNTVRLSATSGSGFVLNGILVEQELSVLSPLNLTDQIIPFNLSGTATPGLTITFTNSDTLQVIGTTVADILTGNWSISITHV